jgi:hypothetical protein
VPTFATGYREQSVSRPIDFLSCVNAHADSVLHALAGRGFAETS